MNLEEIKKYDDYFWLRYLKENTIFDADNIKAQKDWLIQRLERYEKALLRSKEVLDTNMYYGAVEEIEEALKE